MTRGRLLLAAVGWLVLAGPSAAAADVPFTREVIDADNPATPDCKAVGDLDGDGFPDVVIGSSEGGGLWWYRNPGWSKHAIRVSGTYTTDMQVGDVDGDGDLDVVVPTGAGVVWYRNPRPAGDPATAPWAEVLIGAEGAYNHDVEVGDLDGDGRLDVVTRRFGGGATYWRQNDPTSWTRIVVSTAGGEGTALGDLDGDGDLDIAHNGFWLENPLPGGDLFTAWPDHPIAGGWPADVGALVVDVDGDGRNDVVLAPSESSGLFAWYGSSSPRTGPWIEHVIDPSVSYFHTFKAADVDGDGDLGLVTAEMHQSADPDEVSVYVNEEGGLAWRQQVVDVTGSHNLRIADIDRDGDVDIVGANWSDGAPDGAAVTLWRNRLRDPAPPLFTGGLWVAAGDLDGDGRAEVVTGADAGGRPRVRAFHGDGTDTGLDFLAYDAAFRGGVRVAVCDVDGDGRLELLTAAGPGGGPHVRVWRVIGIPPALGATEIFGFMAYDGAFAGGVFIACADVDADIDGRAEPITGAGPGGGPHVRVWKMTGVAPALGLAELAGFYAYDPAFGGGVRVAAADVAGDGRAEVVTGAGPGGGPHVRVFDLTLGEIGAFYAFDPRFTGGVHVAAGDLDAAPGAELVTAADAGGGPHVRVWSLATGEVGGFYAYHPAFAGGVRVAVGDADGDGAADVLTGAGPGGGPHVRGFRPSGAPTATSFMADQ